MWCYLLKNTKIDASVKNVGEIILVTIIVTDIKYDVLSALCPRLHLTFMPVL